MNKIDYQALREAAERAIPAMEHLLMLPVDDDLLTEQELKDYGVDIDALNAFKFLTGPETVLALLDERERNQQYIKRRDQENEEIALTVGKLRVELEGKDSKIANLTAERDALREGEMGDARHSNTRSAADIYFQLVEECEIPAGGSLVEYVDDMREKLEAAEKRIAELESLTVPQLPQPAPVAVPDAMEMDDDFDSAFEHGKAVGWNAYRAAMLQAEPVSNSDELPLDYLQGHKDGLEWAAQLAEANHPQTGDWLYDDPIDLARAIRKGPDMPTVQAGNSPVTPDGWISCSERMPEGYADVLVTDGEHVEVKWWDESGYWDSWTELNSDIFDDEITHWMPLPEPPL